MKLLLNHLGYESQAPKRAVLQGSRSDQPPTFRVLEAASGQVVFTGQPVEVGAVRNWHDWHYWTLEFSALSLPGEYILECGQARSCPFRVEENLFQRRALSNVIYYFKAQRSSGQYDQVDRALPFVGSRPGTVDVRGGWYDATGDYGKHLSHLCFATYFNPQQTPLVVWSLLKTHQQLARRADPNFREYLRRLLDEGLYGTDHLVRLKDPSASFYITVQRFGPEKNPADCRLGKRMLSYSLATEDGDRPDLLLFEAESDQAYQAGFRSGAGLSIAALARAGAYGIAGDFQPSEYLQAAESGFQYLEAYNLSFTNDGRENILDDYCALLAAVELCRATGKAAYRQAADRRALSLMERLTLNGDCPGFWRADDGDRPFFHPSDAGLPLVALLEYAEIASTATREPLRRTIRQSLEFELALTAEVANPFGYARQWVQDGSGRRRTAFFFPHDTETAPWWQGENARLGSLAAAARLALPWFEDDPQFQRRLQGYALDQLNWILGLNPFDACMVHGLGRNNPEYKFFESYSYANCPGGICNGITAGFDDSEGLDFQRLIPGQDHDWRWGEQWLPHAAWFLLAAAL